jgi:ABC-type sugar transport system substrate-binding protein
MKSPVLITLLIVGFIGLYGCNQAAATAPIVESPVPPTATVTETVIPPTPTAEPVIPCNIVFDSDRDGNHEIYSMSPDGSNQVNLTNNSADDQDPVWSKDGTFIAFISDRESADGGGRFLYIMKADGSEVTQVSHQADSNFPDWSPLGTQIAYNSNGDLYLLNVADGTEVNLTNSPEQDEQPKFSPDGQRIAWLKDEGGIRQIYVMDLDGSNAAKVTNGGDVKDLEWTIDGRLFTHWEQPEGICFNCVVSPDGKDVIDGGGKGTIQQFLPFWTANGDRVELGSGDIKGSGHEDIFLVGEIYPDMFNYLTNDSGNNRNPDTAALCGPYYGANPSDSQEQAAQPTEAVQPAQKFVIGYTGSINPMQQKDFDVACSELNVECVHGENLTALADQGVDAIVNASNRWDVMGSYPAIHDISSRGIPLFLLNAESDESGVYNLSAENDIFSSTLKWMFKNLNGQGEVVYYNFGNGEYIQNIVDAALSEFPGITAVKKEADYNNNPFSVDAVKSLIASDPKLGAIWSSDLSTDLFWGVLDQANSHMVLTVVPSRKDTLIGWKNKLDNGSSFKGIAYIHPGGTAYEGIYVAYYYLSGLKFNPDKLTGNGHNTLHYAVPEITNENLPEWLNKFDSFRVGDNEEFLLAPMDPEQIKNEWFLP